MGSETIGLRSTFAFILCGIIGIFVSMGEI